MTIKIVTPPGVNLPPALNERYDIRFTPGFIVADGIFYKNVSLDVARVEELVQSAKEHPKALPVVGMEFVMLLLDLTADSNAVIVTTPAHKLVKTHWAAHAAVERLAKSDAKRAERVIIVDSQSADIGTGLITLFCALSAEAGRDAFSIGDAARKLAATMRTIIVPQSLAYLAAGGRANALQAWALNLVGRVPVLAFDEGMLTKQSLMPRRSDQVTAIADMFEAALGKGRRVWAAVSHGDNEPHATRLRNALHERFDVVFSYQRELAPAYYVNIGPGTLAAAVLPVDGFPWDLPLIEA